MADSVPQSPLSRSHVADRRISRRRLLTVGAAVPAAIVVAKALPSHLSTSAASQTRPVTSTVAASTLPTAAAYYFC